MHFHLLRTDSSDPDFRKLVTLLDADLAIRDGNEHEFYHQFNKIDSIKNVVVYYEDNVAAGCGAIKEYEGNAEIKRMYVIPSYRGRNIGMLILRELETWAHELHYPHCILETGKKQPEAISLYKKAGYLVIPNYGQYAGVENSVCMKKAVH